MAVDEPTIYCDGTHLAAPGHEAALHRFARRMGLRREWFQPHPRHPHYDVMGGAVDRAFAAGAVKVSSRELSKMFKALAKERAARATDKVVDLLQIRQDKQFSQALQKEQAEKDKNSDIEMLKKLVSDFEFTLCETLVRKDGNPMDLESAQWLLNTFWRGPKSPSHTHREAKIFRCPFQEGDSIEFEGQRFYVARWSADDWMLLFYLNRDGKPSKAKALQRDHEAIERESNWPFIKVISKG